MSIENWNITNNWTLFLDRDGVINQRIFGGYITKVEDFYFIKGVDQSIAELSHFFHKVIVVTNQQGVGKGLMTESNLLEIHRYMEDVVQLKGGEIDKCYFAANLRGVEEDRRKPKPYMAENAKREFPGIVFSDSIMVGDTDSDIKFGMNLGMKTVRVKTEEEIGIEADLTVESLNELLNILNNAHII